MTKTIYRANSVDFTSFAQATEHAKRVCMEQRRPVSVWVDGEDEARVTFYPTLKDDWGVDRATPKRVDAK